MKLGVIVLPDHAIADDPDLLQSAVVDVDYDIAGNAVIFSAVLQGGQAIQINAGLTDYQTAKQLKAMTGTVQVLDLGVQSIQVLVQNVAATPVRQYETYQLDDPFTVTIDAIKL